MKKKPAPRNALYAQSGGVTAVINASALGVIEACRRHRDRIRHLYAGRDGIVGALTEELIDIGREDPAAIRALRHTPSGAFGSARYKLKDLERDRAKYERLIEVFRAHDIGYFFYNGGNDSMDTALKLSELGGQLGHPVACIGIPKTVDNDLPVTDCCPGFGSVAKYVAVSTLEASLDVASMARTSTKVFILEVMGRHAGWIAAAGGLAARRPATRRTSSCSRRSPSTANVSLRACAKPSRKRVTASSSPPKARVMPKGNSSPTWARATPSVTCSWAASRRRSPR